MNGNSFNPTPRLKSSPVSTLFTPFNINEAKCDYTLSNNETYGVIPYIAPEIFKGAAFSKESDIYSMGMVMWELTTGCKPFANVEYAAHDIDLIYKIIDGKRSEITNDTPKSINNWLLYINNENFYNQQNNNGIIEQFKQAEGKILELIQSQKLGPEFNKKFHSGAIYTKSENNEDLDLDIDANI
ncbi:hypothetical protein C1645_827096 [Glomus cerebriforme]|uniref:Protein kinase domain-containing protein n=1 Tax=Glomus cerebriforme TaxID=658196 RepID=A0A397SPK0_9GLOM|nr:hypothetical protein C1645_827096 [Glomus cerebriforme]